MKTKESEDFFINLDKELGTDFFNVIKQINFLKDNFEKKFKSRETEKFFTKEERDDIWNDFFQYLRPDDAILGFRNKIPSRYKKMEPGKIKELFAKMKQALNKAQEVYDKLNLERNINIKSIEEVFRFINGSDLSEKDKRVSITFLREMFKE